MQASTPAPVPSTPSSASPWTPQRVILATLAVVTVCATAYLLWRFTEVLFIVFIAAVLGTALRPAVLRLKRFGIPERVGIIVMYAILLLGVGGVIAALIPLLVNQGGKLIQDVPTYYAELRNTFVTSGSALLRNLGANLPATLSLNAGQTTVAEAPTSDVLNQALIGLQAGGWALFGTLGVLLIAFFWILDRDQIAKAMTLFFPLDRRPAAAVLWEEIEQKVGGYIRGTAILCLSISVLTGIALVIIGAPSALIVAVIAGIMEAIPYVGPFLTLAVAVIVTLAEAPEKLVWVIAACMIVQQIENAILVPRIMSQTVGVNAIVTLLAIAAFASLLGLLGAILAIPLAAIIQVLLDQWVRQAENASTTIVGRDRVAALRYQAQDLAQDLRGRIRVSEEVDPDDVFEERIETLVGDLDKMLEQMTVTPAPTLATPEVVLRGAA